MTRIRIQTLLIATLFTATIFAQYGQYSTRSLLEKTIYYIAGGKVSSANYWSLPVGMHECTLNRYFPGEGKVNITANVNFALLSSGYIEGSGYGARGKTTAEAVFAIADGDTLKEIDLVDIDYAYWGGTKVKLAKGEETDLFLKCEINKLIPKRMQIMVWSFNKIYGELKHDKDVERVVAFSFTKAGAYRALKAQKKMAALQK